MKRIQMTSIVLIVAAIIFPAIRCVNTSAGIETTNGATVVASASSITGTVPPYARVALFDTAFIPVVYRGQGLTSNVDKTGIIEFNDLAPSIYTVIVEMPENQKAAAFQGIAVGPSAADSTMHKILEATGTLTGTVTAANDSGTGLLLYLVGTGYYLVLPGPGPFTFESIAPGNYELQAVGLTAGGLNATPIILTSGARKMVTVNAGRETAVETLALP
jgi:hypothetical protein